MKHAGGMARLLEMRGPIRMKDEFEWQIIGQIQGPVVGTLMVVWL